LDKGSGFRLGVGVKDAVGGSEMTDPGSLVTSGLLFLKPKFKVVSIKTTKKRSTIDNFKFFDMG